jgi:hypothetical protein
MHRMRLALIAVVVSAATACGGGVDATGIASLQEPADDPGTGVTTTTIDSDEAMIEFAACMRGQGIDMPDPVAGSADGGLVLEFTVEAGEGELPDLAQTEDLDRAFEECSHLLDGVVQQFDLPEVYEVEDTLLAFAECMREHGVDMPDPEFDGAGGVMEIGPDVDPSDPEFQDAQEACMPIFGGGGPVEVGPPPGD